MKTPACEHPEEEGCMYCCEACNYVKHLCPGCGTDVPHGTVACTDCSNPRWSKNWCDWHDTDHGDIIAFHCDNGDHCTSTTASCAAELGADDHPNKCCDCKRPIEEPTIKA